MMPTKYNLILYRGDDWSITVSLLTDGIPDDLTGITWLSQMRETPRSAETTAVITVTVPNPITGEVTLYLPSSTVTSLPSSLDLSSGGLGSL